MSRRGWMLFAALSVIWGLPYLLIKVAVEEVSPGFVVAGRLALASALMLPWVLRRHKLAQLRGYWGWVVALAAIEMMIPFGLLSWAETRVTSSLAGLMIASVPTISALAAAWLGLADRLDARRFVGLIVGVTGVALLVGFDVRSDTALAVLALLGVATGYAIGPIILNTRLNAPPGPLVMAAATTIAAVGYLPWLLTDWPSSATSAKAWWAIATLGALCTATAFLLMYALVAEAGPTRMTVITYLNPVIAVALGVMVLGESLTVGILVGFPLILAGSILATSRRTPVDLAAAG